MPPSNSSAWFWISLNTKSPRRRVEISHWKMNSLVLEGTESPITVCSPRRRSGSTPTTWMMLSFVRKGGRRSLAENHRNNKDVGKTYSRSGTVLSSPGWNGTVLTSIRRGAASSGTSDPELPATLEESVPTDILWCCNSIDFSDSGIFTENYNTE